MNFKSFTREEMLALMAANSPNPSEAEIMHQLTVDMNRNPHNDHHKPPRRGRSEIVADYKLDHAKVLMERLEARVDKGNI